MYEKTIHLKSFKTTFILKKDDLTCLFVGDISYFANKSLYIATVLARP